MACDSGTKDAPEDPAKPKPPEPEIAIANPVPDATLPPSPPTRRGVQTFEVSSPMSLAVVGKTLVWTDPAGAVNVMPTSGGPIKELSNQYMPGRPHYMSVFAIDANTAVLTEGEKVATLTLPGGSFTQVIQMKAAPNGDTNSVYSVSAVGGAVYGALSRSGQVVKIGMDGKVTKLYDHRSSSVRVLGDMIYSVSYSSGTLLSARLAGGGLRTIAKGLPRPTGFAVDASAAYVWCEGDQALRKIDLKTGKSTVLVPKGTISNGDWIVEDGDYVYSNTWLDVGASKFLRIKKDGSGTEVLADKLFAPYGIAVDAEAIYLADRDGNRIYRFDKATVTPL